MKVLLFVPAHVNHFIGKAHQLQQVTRGLVVVFDLEDGCPPEDRVRARENVARYMRSDDMVRVSREDFELDLAVLPASVAGVIVPKATPKDERTMHLGSLPRISLIETAEGLEYVREIAWFSEGLLAGHEQGDLMASMRSKRFGREVRERTLIAAKAHGRFTVAPPCGSRQDEDVAREARDHYELGFDAMMALWPSQVPLIQEHGQATEDELAELDRVARLGRNIRHEGGRIYGPPHQTHAALVLSGHKL